MTADPRAVARDRARSRRPITDEEGVFLDALGDGLRQARLARGMGLRELAAVAAVNKTTLWRLETGRRRTRASTLRRLAEGLTPWADESAPDEAEIDALTERLVMLAGPALAPESPHADRIARRRERRHRKKLRELDRLLDERKQREARARWRAGWLEDSRDA